MLNRFIQPPMVVVLASLLMLALAGCGPAPAEGPTGGESAAAAAPPTGAPAPPEPTATRPPVPPPPTATEAAMEMQGHTEEAGHMEGGHMEGGMHEEGGAQEVSASGEAPGQDAAAVEEGKALFVAKGCSACHGPEAQGTELAPALPGHTAEQVRRQVRTPVDKMPPFTEEQVSDAELEKIVAFITSLAPSETAMHRHEHQPEMATPVQIHLQMALLSFEAENTADAQHHLQHAAAVAEGGQARAIEAILESLNGGDTHAVQHELEEMLAEAPELEEKTLGKLHLELARSALEARDAEDARHHVEHYVEVVSGADKLKGQQILKLMDGQEFHDAGHNIEELLGMTPYGGG